MDKSWILVLILCGLMICGCFWFGKQMKAMESDLVNRPGNQFLLSK